MVGVQCQLVIYGGYIKVPQAFRNESGMNFMYFCECEVSFNLCKYITKVVFNI